MKFCANGKCWQCLYRNFCCRFFLFFFQIVNMCVCVNGVCMVRIKWRNVSKQIVYTLIWNWIRNMCLALSLSICDGSTNTELIKWTKLKLTRTHTHMIVLLLFHLHIFRLYACFTFAILYRTRKEKKNKKKSNDTACKLKVKVCLFLCVVGWFIRSFVWPFARSFVLLLLSMSLAVFFFRLPLLCSKWMAIPCRINSIIYNNNILLLLSMAVVFTRSVDGLLCVI